MDRLTQHIRHAFAALVRAPAYSVTVIVILALGIGATTAVFCAIDAVLLQPLPFPAADRLVRVSQTEKNIPNSNISPARLQDWSRLSTAFDALSGYYSEDISDTTGDFPERVRRATVAPQFMAVWGVSPALGRGFSQADYGAGNVLLISDRYWHSRFSADPNVLHRAVKISGHTWPIIGVMPAAFAAVDHDVDFWVPMGLDPARIPRQAPYYTGVGRLKGGVSVEAAQTNLGLVQSQLARQFAATDSRIAPDVTLLQEASTADMRVSLLFLFGAVWVLLLIACTNIASLLLSHAAQREQEIAVYFSLGASRLTVIGQLLTETALLALAGALLGVLVAATATALLRELMPSVPHIEELVISWRVVSFAVLTAAGVTVICGLIPAVRSIRTYQALRTGARTQVSSRHILQWGLAGAQVALSVALLSGAGLLLRSLDHLSRVDTGFDARGVVTFHVSGGYSETLDMNRMLQRIQTTIGDLAALPGIEAASTAARLPGVGTDTQTEYQLVESSGDRDSRFVVQQAIVSPGYFSTLKIPILSGETCRAPAALGTAVSFDAMVNREFVERFMGGRSPIGLHLKDPALSAISHVVGVVANAREIGVDRAPEPTIYTCDPAPNPFLFFLVRTRGDPRAVIGLLRARLKEREPLRAVYEIGTLQDRIDAAYAQNRIRTLLLLLFAVAALLLTCLGIYGTLSYSVALRQREVGLLLALGAYRRQIIVRFLLEALVVVGIACVAGVALTLGSSRLLSGMLFGVAPTDLTTLSSVVVLVVVVAVTAALVPATRAAMLDPMLTLREE